MRHARTTANAVCSNWRMEKSSRHAPIAVKLKFLHATHSMIDTAGIRSTEREGSFASGSTSAGCRRQSC